MWHEIEPQTIAVDHKELANERLARALHERKKIRTEESRAAGIEHVHHDDDIKFTHEEWHAFGIEYLDYEHYVKCGEEYFQPIAVDGRSKEDYQLFKNTLKTMLWLYHACRVLSLVGDPTEMECDESGNPQKRKPTYIERFWPCVELWSAMRKCTMIGEERPAAQELMQEEGGLTGTRWEHRFVADSKLEEVEKESVSNQLKEWRDLSAVEAFHKLATKVVSNQKEREVMVDRAWLELGPATSARLAHSLPTVLGPSLTRRAVVRPNPYIFAELLFYGWAEQELRLGNFDRHLLSRFHKLLAGAEDGFKLNSFTGSYQHALSDEASQNDAQLIRNLKQYHEGLSESWSTYIQNWLARDFEQVNFNVIENTRRQTLAWQAEVEEYEKAVMLRKESDELLAKAETKKAELEHDRRKLHDAMLLEELASTNFATARWQAVIAKLVRDEKQRILASLRAKEKDSQTQTHGLLSQAGDHRTLDSAGVDYRARMSEIERQLGQLEIDQEHAQEVVFAAQQEVKARLAREVEALAKQQRLSDSIQEQVEHLATLVSQRGKASQEEEEAIHNVKELARAKGGVDRNERQRQEREALVAKQRARRQVAELDKSIKSTEVERRKFERQMELERKNADELKQRSEQQTAGYLKLQMDRARQRLLIAELHLHIAEKASARLRQLMRKHKAETQVLHFGMLSKRFRLGFYRLRRAKAAPQYANGTAEQFGSDANNGEKQHELNVEIARKEQIACIQTLQDLRHELSNMPLLPDIQDNITRKLIEYLKDIKEGALSEEDALKRGTDVLLKSAEYLDERLAKYEKKHIEALDGVIKDTTAFLKSGLLADDHTQKRLQSFLDRRHSERNHLEEQNKQRKATRRKSLDARGMLGGSAASGRSRIGASLARYQVQTRWHARFSDRWSARHSSVQPVTEEETSASQGQCEQALTTDEALPACASTPSDLTPASEPVISNTQSSARFQARHVRWYFR